MGLRRLGRLGLHTILIALVLVVAAGCSDGTGDDDRGDATTTTTAPEPTATTPPPGEGPAPRPTLGEAVELFLTAEQDADPAASYRFLGEELRGTYRDVAEWTVRRSQLPPPTGFEIEDTDEDDTVTAIVTHEPGLDPFIGLSPARERQTFTGVEEGGGWLIAAEAEVEILFPDDALATTAVTDWATAVQACDEAAADELQGIDAIFGTSVGAGELCGSEGAVTAEAPERLLGGPESADLIAQYSTDAIDWARAVPVTGPTSPFFVIVAPIGDTWSVIGVYD